MSPLTKTLFLIFFFFFISICTLKNPYLVFRCGLTTKAHDSDPYFQDLEKALSKFKTYGQKEIMWSTTIITTTTTSTRTSTITNRRRILRGLGSSPPRCAWKCGRCTPCKPVHVPVPPGTPVTAEYYPEAWRCKCGNKLYMP